MAAARSGYRRGSCGGGRVLGTGAAIGVILLLVDGVLSGGL
jgi:hypothetical protein